MKNETKKKKKVLFISSLGGHLTQLLQLKPLFKEYDYHIITEKSIITEDLSHQIHMSFLAYGREIIYFGIFSEFSYNIFKSCIIFYGEKPDVIVTTGAHTASSSVYTAKILEKK